MIDKRNTKVDDIKNVSYNEMAEEVFTLNIGCPHCKKPISLSLAKITLEECRKKGDEK